jgi:S1-C subfamily serine protease
MSTQTAHETYPVKAEIAQLEAGSSVAHPYPGVAPQEASINQHGAQVQSVASGSPAATRGSSTLKLTATLASQANQATTG